MDVFPAEEQKVLLKNRLDVIIGKLLTDRAAMFVPDLACRLVENLPAAFPGEETDVRVLEIEGREEFVKASQFQKLALVICAGATTTVGARKEA